MLVHRRCDGEMGYRAERCQVESTVVGRSVFAYQSGTVQTEYYRQIEQRHVVDDIIIGSLCKRTVDIAERLQSVFRHTGRESHGMSFCDTHVEHTVGHSLHHDIHRATGRHGRCHTHDLLVFLRQFEQGISENILELRRLVAGISDDTLSSLRVEFARRMPDGGTLLGRFITLALGGMEMQELRSLHVLELHENPYYLLHVMTIERSEISDVHSLEDVLLMAECRLQCIVEPYDALLAVFIEIALGMEPL